MGETPRDLWGHVGLLITLEGGEGAGKSTQIGRLRDRVAATGREVVTTREPGGSPRAEAIRELLLAGRARRFGPAAEAMLFAAARADHVATLIAPAMRRGAIVLCDRFIDSTRVYQGVVAGVGRPELARLEAATLGGTVPDLTLLLDVPARTGLARAASRRQRTGDAVDRFEQEGVAFHDTVRRAFLALAAAEPARCRVIDASGGAEVVADAIWSVARPFVDAAGRAPDAG